VLSNIRIILVEPQYPRNIGSAARALKNMGLKDLYLVKPANLTNPETRQMASGAIDLLEQAQIVDSLELAIADCDFIVATSSRCCSFSWPVMEAREACAAIHNKLTNNEANKVAIIFGTERTGLDTEQLQLANLQLQIAADPEYPVLNLAQTIQIVTYELRMAFKSSVVSQPLYNPTHDYLATASQREGLYEHLERFMLRIGFLNPQQPKNLMPRLRRLFTKANLEAKEINIIRGILTTAESHIKC
jgi:tRNA (cytidine32/uridine32-2'-O)-methyltransferase